MMNSNLSEKIKKCLLSSEFAGGKTKDDGRYISPLKCPECDRWEAYAYSDKPYAIICNRQNNCRARLRTLEVFPNLTRDVENDFPPTQKDQHRPATEYLLARGLEKSLTGLEPGKDYWYQKNIRRTGSGGVMFRVEGRIANGRIFNPPKGEGKTHNNGRIKGKYWKHPALSYDPNEETFVTEGILDALSLIELGFQAIAVLAAGGDPAGFDLSGFPNIIFAFDNDTAGANALKKWWEYYKPTAKEDEQPEEQHDPVSAVMPLKGDWNDLLTKSAKESARKYFDDHRKEFQVKAKLALAKTAKEYAKIYSDYYNYAPNLFIFKGSYYYSYFKKVKNEEKLITSQVGRFYITVDHCRLDNTNEDEPENKYFITVNPRKGRKSSFHITGKELSAAQSLRSTLLNRGRVLWRGEMNATFALIQKIIESNAPVVRHLQTVGYDEKSDCYVFKHFLINKKGKYISPNPKGFFPISTRDFLLPATYQTVKPTKGIPARELCDLIFEAWGRNGLVAVSFMVAGWFVTKIKTDLGFFPILSFFGDTQTGKSRLVRLLNAMQCQDEEGMPMSRVNTSKGEIRKLAQRAGLFKALLEGNNPEGHNFDYDSILTLYNDNPIQTRALTSNDIRTNDIPFLASILFVQNKEPFRTRAQKERVISLEFSQDDISEKTTKAFDALMKISVSELAHFFVEVMEHRELFESSWKEEFDKARAALFEKTSDPRISENYALILGFYNLLSKAIGIEYDLQPYFEKIAIKKVSDCSHQQDTLAHYFFEALNQFEEERLKRLVETDSENLYISLPAALGSLRDAGLDPGRTSEVQAALKEHPAFVRSNVSHYGSFGNNSKKTCKVWVFNKKLVSS